MLRSCGDAPELYGGVMGDIGVACECSDDQRAVGCSFNLIERKDVDVDDLSGALDVEFHQVD
jgi:hypothetical protein